MKLNLTSVFTARYWALLMSVLLLTLVSACGGGNGSAGTPIGGSGGGSGGGGSGGTSTNGGISLTLTNAGAAATAIPTNSYLTATAKVVNASGAAVTGTLVTFTVSNSAGVLSPTLGTAVTDSSGSASIILQAGSSAGAGQITATAAPVTSTSVTASVAFTNTGSSTGSSNSPSLVLSYQAATGCPGGSTAYVSTSCPLTVNATIMVGTQVQANVPVTFGTTASLTSLTPSAGTALTNPAGVASIQVTPVNLATALQQAGAAGQVSASATVNGTTITSALYYVMGSTSVTQSLVQPAPTAGSTTSGTVSFNAYGSTTIKVQVNSNGAIYTAQPVTVNFSSTCQTLNKATLASSATTVGGVATVSYTDLGCGSSTDTVTASVAGSAIPVTVTLNVTPPAPASINFVSATPTGESIVLPGTGGNTRTSTATLTYKVVDTSGNPLANQTVIFGNQYPLIANLTTPSGVTNSQGLVTATVTALSVGNFRITATSTYGTGASAVTISSISDTIIVSTGTPVQAAFTLTASTFNVEGWEYVRTTTLTAYLADKNGNPVADGTPVSTTTRYGSVGDSALGGCVTADKGYCTVTFTTTDPRPGDLSTQYPNDPPGIANIEFTTSTLDPTTGDPVTLYGFIPITFSSEYPTFYPLTYSAVVQGTVSGNTLTVATAPAPALNTGTLVANDVLYGAGIPAGTTIKSDNGSGSYTISNTLSTPVSLEGIGANQGFYSSSGGAVITIPDCNFNIPILLTDINGNPMAAGTTIAASTTQTGISFGPLIPAVVPNTPAQSQGTTQGVPTVTPPTTTVPATAKPIAILPASANIPNVQGTLVTVPIIGTNCQVGGSTVSTASFTLTVTSEPGGIQTLGSFVVRYQSP